MPFDRQGNKLTWKEFMERWKDGIQKVTPLQQLKVQMIGFVIVTVGVAWGLVVALYSKTWWLFVILLGSSFVITTQFLPTLQKYFIIKKVEEEMKGGLS